MENGKLGFTRELYDYYFDYELPVGKKVNLKIVSTQQKTELFAKTQQARRSGAGGECWRNH